MTPLIVALAGGLGAITRFVVDAEIGRRVTRWGIPLGTALINVSGSFLLGLVVGWWTFHTADPGLKAALGTGFMGGYTTFSTASVEAARLARADRRWTLLLHAGGTLALGVVGAGFGFWLGSLL